MPSRLKLPDDAGKKTSSLESDVLKQWPSLPFISMGLWLAWSFLAYSGSIWLSDTEIDGSSLSLLYIISTIAAGLVGLSSGLFPRKVAKILSSPRGLVAAGSIASIGCLLIILAGPYYFFSGALFNIGAAMSGIGTGLIAMKYGDLYGRIPPKRALLYACYSHVLVVFIYYLAMGITQWAPIQGGPAISGILSFVFLPLLASLILRIGLKNADRETQSRGESETGLRSLPLSFWKMIVMVTVFSIVISIVRSVVVNYGDLALTVGNSYILMFFRLLVSFVFLLICVRWVQKIDFGRLYSVLSVFMVTVIAVIPVFGLHDSWLTTALGVAQVVFELALWCMLSFIVFQKRIHPLLVYGLGFGSYTISLALGWFIGVNVLSDVLQGPDSFMVYLVLAGLVLIVGIIVFSERDYQRLFSPIREGELDLATLLVDDDASPSNAPLRTERKRRFGLAIETLSSANNLSKREIEVFRLLAMGRGSEQIATQLYISFNTARAHTHNIYLKLGVHSRQELIDLVEETSLEPLP